MVPLPEPPMSPVLPGNPSVDEKVASYVASSLRTSLLVRLLSFLSSVLVIRRLPASLVALSSMHLELLFQLTLVLRDPLRRACSRGATPSLSSYLLLSLWSLFTGLVFFLNNNNNNNNDSNETRVVPGVVVALVVVSAMIEIGVEPIVAAAARAMVGGVRGRVEMVSVAVRAVVLYVAVVGFGWGLVGFGVAQMAASVVMAAGMARWWWRQGRGRLFGSEGILGSEWARVYVVQGVAKVVLAEGEKVMLMGLATLAQQGGFVVVSNLGSIVVRFLFQPIEDMANQTAARMTDRARAERVCALLFKVVTLVGLVGALLGPPYAHLVLAVLYGPAYVEGGAPDLLALYCAYLLLLAANGVTEAYVHGTATPGQLATLNTLMFAFSATHVAAALVFTAWEGARGMVLASCLSMALRIAVSAWFLSRNLVDPAATARAAAPSPAVVACLAGAAVLTRLTLAALGPVHPAHILAGVVSFSAVLLVVRLFDAQFLIDARATLAASRRAKSD